MWRLTDDQPVVVSASVVVVTTMAVAVETEGVIVCFCVDVTTTVGGPVTPDVTVVEGCSPVVEGEVLGCMVLMVVTAKAKSFAAGTVTL